MLLFAALALFGWRYHWVEEAGTAERDGYAAQADQLLAGRLPHDPFRPLLFPAATAALAGLTGSTFAAARLLSNLSAAVLAWLAYATGKRLGGQAVGGWAMALAAVNPNIWIIGQHASTDMFFAALSAAALLAGLRYMQEAGVRAAAAAGLALGLADFARSNALFLVPALLAAWWLAPGPRDRRLPHLAAAAGVCVLVLLPHWALRYAAFGNPFHDENWKNLAWKLHGYPDWSYLSRVPYASGAAVIAESPAAVLEAGLAELRRFAAEGAPQLLGTWGHVALFLAGTAWALRHRWRPAAWLLGSGLVFLAAAAVLFFTWGRLLLLLLPGWYALAFSPMGGASRNGLAPGPARSDRFRLVAAGAGAALVLLLAVKTFAFRLPAFVARHPYVEVAALRHLDATLPPGGELAGTSPFLGRYLRHPYVAVPDAFGAEVADPGLYYTKLRRLLAGSRVAYLVAGSVDIRDRPASLLGAAAPVPWLQPAGRYRGVSVWRVR
ncbi:MAG TPA: glycosyltransferase family 39 protein [Thermoanaerobaculia bacterium]|nr:glycosyltransferase family 39 protein [Thermoanaerobaculia bacterium]